MSQISNVADAITNLAAQIKDLTVNPKPSYSINGQAVSWGEYLAMLTDQLDKMLVIQQKIQGPFIIQSRGGSL